MGRLGHDRDYQHLGEGPEGWATRRLLPTDPIYISVAEVCQVLGVTRGTVHSWIRAGLCPALQIGGKGTSYRVPASWLIDTCRKGVEYRQA